MGGMRVVSWLRDGMLKEGTPKQQRNLARMVAHPLLSIAALASLFGAIDWLFWIRSTEAGGLVGLAVTSLLWGIFMFFVFRWRYRKLRSASSDPAR